MTTTVFQARISCSSKWWCGLPSPFITCGTKRCSTTKESYSSRSSSMQHQIKQSPHLKILLQLGDQKTTDWKGRHFFRVKEKMLTVNRTAWSTVRWARRSRKRSPDGNSGQPIAVTIGHWKTVKKSDRKPQTPPADKAGALRGQVASQFAAVRNKKE